ncbi:hypothetical protein BJY04DRAFT_221199 [Aspergillus karnatakaensis]|uniref:WXG100 family type VII secretion target n=1 Tax=Aspergillus karnatakaensis TaxID=1810916 RepID=UPI003CCD968C
MHFSKVLSSAAFVALATTAPLPSPEISTNVGEIQALSQSIASFAASTNSGLNRINDQFQATTPALGASADTFTQLLDSFQQAESQLQQVAAKISEGLASLTGSFEQSEQSATNQLAASFSKRDISANLAQSGVPYPANPVTPISGIAPAPIPASSNPSTGYWGESGTGYPTSYWKRDAGDNPSAEHQGGTVVQAGGSSEGQEQNDGRQFGVPVAAHPGPGTGYPSSAEYPAGSEYLAGSEHLAGSYKRDARDEPTSEHNSGGTIQAGHSGEEQVEARPFGFASPARPVGGSFGVPVAANSVFGY